jgi:hypothetical protein
MNQKTCSGPLWDLLGSVRKILYPLIIKIIKQFSSNTPYFIISCIKNHPFHSNTTVWTVAKLKIYILCVRLRVSAFTGPSSGLLTNQVDKCWMDVGFPTMFIIDLVYYVYQMCI